MEKIHVEDYNLADEAHRMKIQIINIIIFSLGNNRFNLNHKLKGA